jgi:hypothetical protein
MKAATATMIYDAIVVIAMTAIFIYTHSAWAFILLLALATSKESRND